ncbi:MAG: hypothetical protein A2W05_05315, partial [Candidatus Schekmanbacteria bacterium RBG_16_38_10]
MKRNKKIDILLYLLVVFPLVVIFIPLSQNSYSLGFRDRVKKIIENRKVKGIKKNKYFAFQYHQFSKHTYLNVITSWKPDWFNEPDTSKIYPDAKTIPLKKDIESWEGFNLDEAIRRANEKQNFSSSEPLTLNEVSRLLYFTYGVTGVIRKRGGILYLRTAPSAGALYPTEIYLIVNNVKDLESGVYNYLVKDHVLQQIKRGDFSKELINSCLNDSSIKNSNLIFVFTDIFYRSKWKYRERGYRYSLIDAGYVIKNLVLESASVGLRTKTYFDFLDDKINKLLGVDGVKEASVALVTVGKGMGDNFSPVGQASRLSERRFSVDRRGFLTPPERFLDGRFKSHRVISQIKESMSISEKYHENSKQIIYRPKIERVSLKPYSIEKRIELPQEFPRSNIKIEELLLKRRSAEDLGNLPISKTELSEILYLSFRLERESHYKISSPHQLDLFLVVNNVQGVDRGVYHYDRQSHSLEQIKKIDLQELCWKYCLRQDI